MCKVALSISILLVAVCCWAQTADDYFHRGAQLYIFNKRPEAKVEISNGLNLFPEDPKLNAMAGLLKNEEQQQQQQQKNQSNDQKQQQEQQQQKERQQAQENQSQQNSGQQHPQQQADQKKQDEQQQQAAQQDQQQQQQQQTPQQPAGQPKQSEEEKEREAAAYAAGQMTPEQAQQLLDAQKGEELMLPAKPEAKPVDRNRPIKDW